MIKFKPIEIQDRQTIESFTMPSGIYNCDLAFANMFCWEFIYHSAWAVVGGFLVIKFRIGGSDRIGYMQPVGPGDFGHIIPSLMEDAALHGQRLRIIGLTDEGCEAIRRTHSGMFAFASDRNMEDYVYNASDLKTLSGRRYQPKRNHINRFEATYDYRYTPLTPEIFDECLSLEAEWRRTHNGHGEELSAEQNAMRIAFDHFGELGLLGGCIHVKNKLVAFTYGSPVNDHTFCIHVEKADTEYDGAFAIINKLFAEYLPEQYTMINREEDLGLEGLRHAKLSYHPEVIQHKFTAICLRPDESACKSLWKECFGDDDSFIDSFIMRYYRKENMLSVTDEEQMVSMLHVIQFESELGRTAYIYSVATATRYRARGLAGRLINEAIEKARQQGYTAVILIPSGGSLRGYYEKFGFEGEIPVCFSSPDNFDFGTGDASADKAMIYRINDCILPEKLHCKYCGE